MIVMQITAVQLRPGMGDIYTANAFQRVTDWLKQWTPRANFKAVLAEDREQALAMCLEDLRDCLVPGWLARETGAKPEHFQFEVSYQEVVAGRFWMSSQAVWCCWHSIPASET